MSTPKSGVNTILPTAGTPSTPPTPISGDAKFDSLGYGLSKVPGPQPLALFSFLHKSGLCSRQLGWEAGSGCVVRASRPSPAAHPAARSSDFTGRRRQRGGWRLAVGRSKTPWPRAPDDPDPESNPWDRVSSNCGTWLGGTEGHGHVRVSVCIVCSIGTDREGQFSAKFPRATDQHQRPSWCLWGRF